MQANDYFRCPACRAKLRFGKRPKARVTCPSCGHQFDYRASSTGSARQAAASSDAPSTADAKEGLGSTAAFGLALEEAAGASVDSEAEHELDLDDESGETSSRATDDDKEEYGPATAPIRPRKADARVDSEPTAATPRPLSKRLRKWYKRSWLSNPSTGGWQIAAAYAAICVLVMVAFLFTWMRQLQSEAGSDSRTSYATVYKDSSSNVSRMGITAFFSLATLFCLPIPYGLWVGSHIGRYAWLFVRGVGYIGALCVLPGALSGSSSVVIALLMGLLVVAAIGNLLGCVLLTTWEGSVGRTLFAVVLIVGSELFALGLVLMTGLPGRQQ
jgi:hypothetical protein